MRITLHQPSFCPYAGFWDKMRESDLFVILNHVQFEKGGYQSRFNYRGKWYTMRTKKGLVPIIEKKYITPRKDFAAICREFSILDQFSHLVSDSLSRTNSRIIEEARKVLKIDTHIEYDYPTDLKGTERLVDICKHYGATEYLSGPSGKNYLDVSLFEKAGIKVLFQEVKDTRALIELL